MTNATLVESLYAIGQHYSCGHGGGCPAANAAGLKFWVSEDFSVNGEVFDGAAYWGSRLSLNWVLLNATATISWALVWSAYDSFGYRGCGLMSAYTPWSGNYLVGDAVWMTAHHTQFMWPGWRLLQSLGNSSAGSSGVLPGGGSWVAARSPDGADFSLVIETLQATDAGYCAPWAPTSAQNLTFLLAPGTGLPGPGSHLQYWQTVEGAAFVHLPDLVVAADGTVSVSVPHQSKVTISTITTASKGGVNASSIPPAAPFALPYADSFDEANYPYDHVPRFLSDTSSTGSFAVRHGVLQQVALALNMNNGWCGCCGFGGPVTTIGEADWLNYTARVSVSFNSGPADRGDASPLPPPPSSPARDVPDTLARVAPCDGSAAQRWLIGAVASGYISNSATTTPTCLKVPRCDGDALFVFGACRTEGQSECGLVDAPFPELQWIVGSQDACKHKLLTRTSDGQCGTASAADGTLFSARCFVPDGPGVEWLYNASGALELAVSDPGGKAGAPPLCLTAPSPPAPPAAASAVARAGLALGAYALILRSDASFILRVTAGPVLARGALRADFNSSAWHALSLAAAGSLLTAAVDGAIVWSGEAVAGFPLAGQVALKSGLHYAAFDNFSVVPTGSGGVQAPRDRPALPA